MALYLKFVLARSKKAATNTSNWRLVILVSENKEEKVDRNLGFEKLICAIAQNKHLANQREILELLTNKSAKHTHIIFQHRGHPQYNHLLHQKPSTGSQKPL